MKREIKNTLLYIGSSIICLGIMIGLINIAYAADIQVVAYVEGGLTLTLNGDWDGDVSFVDVLHSSVATSTYWTSVESEDYITFVDDTNEPGFNINLSLSDFSYTGSNPDQNAISASNFSIIGKYISETPSPVTKGYDDSSHNLSILPNSCAGATTDKFTFNSDFLNSGTNYTFTASNIDQILLQSSADCLSIGHIRFDRTELQVPGGSAAGTYTATLTYTIIDGTP